MPANYAQSCPNLFKDSNGNVTDIHHNHCKTIEYDYFRQDNLNKMIDNQKVALTGCITFFQTIVDDKKTDVLVRAAAKGALEEDKARLKEFSKHKHSGCNLL